jgi:hypothetical protein
VLISGGAGANPSWTTIKGLPVLVVAASDSPAAFKAKADYVCDGTDDQVQIQAAVDTLTAGGRVELDGTFAISASVNLSGKSNIHMSGNALLVRSASMSDGIISTAAATLGTARIVQANYSIGARTLALSSVSGFSVGSVVSITELNSSSYQHMDTVDEVDSSGGTITLRNGLKWGATSGVSNVAVVSSGMTKNISIEGLRFADAITTATSNQAIIDMRYVDTAYLSNLTFNDISGLAAISFDSSLWIDISHIKIDKVIHPTLGYGITTGYGTSNVTISDSLINRTRHAVTGDRSYDIAVSNVVANGITTLANTSHSFDTHQYMKDISYTNCVSNGAFGGMNVRGQRINISNFIVNGTSKDAFDIQTTAKDVMINNVQINNTGSWDANSTVYPVWISSTNVTINGLRITQDYAAASNTMRSVYVTGSSNISISNLDINDIAAEFVHGVDVEGTSSNIKITGATINTYRNGKSVLFSANTTNSVMRDIRALEVVANIGTGNVIENVSSYVNKNTGTATVATGNTSIVVTHGLAAAPIRVQVTPTTDTGGKRYWISAKTATTFTITIDSANASDIAFDWRATAGEGY